MMMIFTMVRSGDKLRPLTQSPSGVSGGSGFETGQRTRGVTNVTSELIIPSSSLDFSKRKFVKTLPSSLEFISYPAESVVETAAAVSAVRAENEMTMDGLCVLWKT